MKNSMVSSSKLVLFVSNAISSHSALISILVTGSGRNFNQLRTFRPTKDTNISAGI